MSPMIKSFFNSLVTEMFSVCMDIRVIIVSAHHCLYQFFLFSFSYPAVIVVPQSVSDDSIRKFARSHRQYR